MTSTELAAKIRIHALRMTSKGKSSHVGSVLSMADLLGVLYASVLKKDPSRPKWSERDRFILSKGHAGAGVYAALAETGFLDPAELMTHYQNGGRLSGHVSHKGIDGIELSTGSLGQGLSVGVGMALSAKLNGESYRVFVLMSDGECDEGSNWEAILFASHHKLSNLTAIVDYNKIQSLAHVKEVLELEPFADKWRAFGWDVEELDGHDHAAVEHALEPRVSTKPKCILAHTVKGKGVDFMEDTVLWHYRSPSETELQQAIDQIQKPNAK